MINFFKQKSVAFSLILIVFLIELLRTAWISDDAMITLRTVLNFIHGYGPSYNIDERVQAYTHPLWFFVISGLSALNANVFTATFILSISISLITFWLLLTKITTNARQGIIVASGLMLSKAFVDFSTSGLENPLSHLLLVILVMLALSITSQKSRAALAGYFFSCALLYLNRPDLSLLILPLTLWVIVKNSSTPFALARSLLFGIIPVGLWIAFSLYYYGFLFPNTAYAKLGTGIPMAEQIHQGCLYLIDSLHRDPLTLAMILLGIIVGACTTAALDRCLSLGIILYLIYIISIGGDFMAGRFLTAPLLVAAIQIARAKWSSVQLLVITFGIGVIGITHIHATLFSGPSYNNRMFTNGIADERGFYFQHFGLLSKERKIFLNPDWSMRDQGVQVRICGGLGGEGVSVGPGIHVLDTCALVDPLLSHLPAQYNPHWRIGHFIRQVPENYLKSIALNKNLLTDPNLKAYYDSIRKVTRSELNDKSRWSEIMRLNFGDLRKGPKEGVVGEE